MQRAFTIVVVAWVLSTVSFAWGQDALEAIPPETAHKFGTRLAELAAKFERPQVTIDPDGEKAVGLHKPREAGVLIVPQKGIKEDGDRSAAKSENGAPLGFLFLYHIVPTKSGKPIDADKLRTVDLPDDDGAVHKVVALILSVKNVGEDDWRLLVFGSGKEPLLDAKFTEAKGNGDQPIGVQIADVKEHTGSLVITVFDKYQAKIPAMHNRD